MEQTRHNSPWITHSIRTPQEITGLFEDGGFELDGLEVVETAGRLGTGKVGPSTAQKATYVEIVASRR